MLKCVMPWNSENVFVVLHKPARKSKFRVVYAGTKRKMAVSTYGASKLNS